MGRKINLGFTAHDCFFVSFRDAFYYDNQLFYLSYNLNWSTPISLLTKQTPALTARIQGRQNAR
jgi:hypothetical protein